MIYSINSEGNIIKCGRTINKKGNYALYTVDKLILIDIKLLAVN